MNASEALKMVEGIPKEQFIAQTYTDEINKCCFFGHAKRLSSSNPDDYSFKNCSTGEHSDIQAPSMRFLRDTTEFAYRDLVDINDRPHTPPYVEPEIKDRLTHFLTDMIKAGY